MRRGIIASVFILGAGICLIKSGDAHIFGIVTAVLVHEAGHLISARVLRIPLIRGGVSPLGIRMGFDFSRAKATHEAAVYLGGSALGLLTAYILSGIFPYSPLVVAFSASSLVLGGINLLPVRGLDGGSALECILKSAFSPDTAYRLVRTVSALTVILLWMLSLRLQMHYKGGISLTLISVYLIYNELKAVA